jgi:hypothetical protein
MSNYLDINLYSKGLFNSSHVHNHYLQWLSNVELKRITKSMLIAYIVATLLQILYTNLPETAFLSFSIHLF